MCERGRGNVEGMCGAAVRQVILSPHNSLVHTSSQWCGLSYIVVWMFTHFCVRWVSGEDFDNTILEFLVAEFKKDQGIDLSKDKLAVQVWIQRREPGYKPELRGECATLLLHTSSHF